MYHMYLINGITMTNDITGVINVLLENGKNVKRMIGERLSRENSVFLFFSD